MDRYRCKLEGYPDDAFKEAFGGNDEKEIAVSWLETFAQDYPRTRHMKVGDSCNVIVETNGKEKTNVMVRAVMHFVATDTDPIVSND